MSTIHSYSRLESSTGLRGNVMLTCFLITSAWFILGVSPVVAQLKKLKAFSSEISELPTSSAAEKVNKDVLGEISKSVTDAKTHYAKAAESIATSQVSSEFELENVQSKVMPAIAHFNSGPRAGLIAVQSNGEVVFKDNEIPDSMALGEDLRFKRLPAGYPVVFGVEYGRANSHGPGNTFTTSKSSNALRPYATKFWDDLLVRQFGELDRLSRFDKLTEAMKKVDGAFNSLTEEASGENIPSSRLVELEEHLRVAQDEALAECGRAFNETTVREEGWVKQWLATLAVTLEQGDKAINGVYLDNYDPEVYEMIVSVTPACGAIQIGNGGAMVSAVLIGEDAILTCQHKIVSNWEFKVDEIGWNNRSKAAKFLLNRERRRRSASDGDAVPITELLYKGEAYLSGSLQPLDYAIFKIDETVLRDLENKRRLQCNRDMVPFFPAKPVRLADNMPDYHNPLFVVGHSGGRLKLVHDSAYLLFPHRVNQDMVSRMHMKLVHSLKNKDSAFQFQRKNLFMNFLENYYRNLSITSEQTRCYMNENGVPVFGLDSDTFNGDSGGPVFDRFTGNVIGVFKGTANIRLNEEAVSPDAGLSFEGEFGDFDHHEYAVPITAIIEQLDKRTNQEWRSKIKGLVVGAPTSIPASASE